MQRSKLSTAAPQVCDRAARCLWCALFLILVTYTGVLSLSWLAVPRITNQLLTLAILILCFVLPLPFGHWRDQTRLVNTMSRACMRLPLAVPFSAAGWLICVAWSTYRSTTPGISLEVFGGTVWVLLLAVLAYGYASRGLRQTGHITGGILAALDAALILGVVQNIAYWSNTSRDMSFHAQHNAVISFLNHPNDFGHYLGLLLPLALWDAATAFRQQQDSHESNSRGEALRNKTRLTPKRLASVNHTGKDRPALRLGQAWQGLWRLWRAARPGVVIALCIATTSRSTWISVAIGLVVYALLWRRVGMITASRLSPDRAAQNAILWRPYRAPLIVGLILSIAVAVPQSTWIVVRLGQMAQPHELRQNTGRSTIWRNTLEMIRQRPDVGYGPGAFAVNYPQFIKPHQVRELVLHAHNTYLHRTVEEGFPALCCWLLLVLVVWNRGLFSLLSRAPTRPMVYLARPLGSSPVKERDGLLLALCCGLLIYGICGVFVMTERTPTMAVHFYIVLALIAAVAWGMDHKRDNSPGVSSRRRLMTAIAIAVLLGTGYYLPWLIRSDLAHLNFDRAMTTESLMVRMTLLRQARNLDQGQPIYWAQLGLARHMVEGAPTARAVTNLYRAALQRAPADGLHWHNIAMLYMQAGDYANAIRNETRAVSCDPTFSLYHYSLAEAYARSGDGFRAGTHRQLGEHFMQREAGGQRSADGLARAQFGGRYRRVVTTPEIIPLPDGDAPEPMR